jgi:hypothetical protein
MTARHPIPKKRGRPQGRHAPRRPVLSARVPEEFYPFAFELSEHREIKGKSDG